MFLLIHPMKLVKVEVNYLLSTRNGRSSNHFEATSEPILLCTQLMPNIILVH